MPRVEATDGLDASALELRAPLEVELARFFPVEYVELDAGRPLALQAGGKALAPAPVPPAGRLRLPDGAQARRIDLVPTEGDTRLSEARFYHLSQAPPPKTAVPLAPADTSLLPPAVGRPGLPPRAVGGEMALPPRAGGWGGPALLFATAPLPAAQGATAIALDLTLKAPFPPGLRLRAVQSSEPDRAWMQLDLAPTTPAGATEARLSLVLDPPDTWCEKGERILLAISAPDGGPAPAVTVNAAGLVTGTREQVRDEFVLSRLNWFAGWYSEHAAAAPWDRLEWNPDREPAIRWLEALQEWRPQHPGVIAYAARVLHLPMDVRAPAPGPANAPAWALLAHQLLKRAQYLAYWYRATRQQPDGLFGTDPGADAALLDTLACVPFITGDPALMQSLRAGAEQAWQSAREAEAAPGKPGEPCLWARAAAYSLPLLLFADPGSPIPVERCLEEAAPLSRWTSVNGKGHRHFVSHRFGPGAGEVDTAGAADVPANALAAGPALAAVWYSGHPVLRRLLCEWAQAWAADIPAPAGPNAPISLPAALDPQTCRPLPAAGGRSRTDGSALLLRLLLDGNRLSGDPKLLEPVRRAIAAGSADPLATCLWRQTGSTEFDDRLAAAPLDGGDLRAYAAWLATGNKQALVEGLTGAISRFDQERYLLTEATPPTDTVEMPGGLLLRFLYLGGPGPWRGGLPRLALTWEGTGAEFAAFVAEKRPDRLKVLAYYFQPQPRPVRLHPWALRAGTYLVTAGPDRNHDDKPDRITEQRVVHIERGDGIPVTLPPQVPFVIQVVAQKTRPDAPLPDLALSAGEITLSPDRQTLTAVVHNIGAAPAKGVRVSVTDGAGQPLGTAEVGDLPWPQDCRPVARKVQVTLTRPAPARVRVTVTSAGPEITHANNSVAGGQVGGREGAEE